MLKCVVQTLIIAATITRVLEKYLGFECIYEK